MRKTANKLVIGAIAIATLNFSCLPSTSIRSTGDAESSSSVTLTGSHNVTVSPANSWATTGPLHTARHGQTTILLNTGLVLTVGGHGGTLASAELYNFTTETWTTTGSLNFGRNYHTATLLQNGKVLVAAGQTAASPNGSTSAELYDPTTGLWTNTGSLNAGRFWHTATLLPSGKVLVTGGTNGGGPMNSAEIYNPTNGTWTTVAATMSVTRDDHTATMLANGKVLIAGGTGFSGVQNTAELFDPAGNAGAGTFGNGTTFTGGRYSHTATVLANGKVLITGGYDNSSALSSSSIYDPTLNSWSGTGALNAGRYLQSSSLLDNGKVLVTGGNDGSSSLSSFEIFDPGTGTWTAVGNFPSNVAIEGHSTTILPNGQALLTGGWNRTTNYTASYLFTVYTPISLAATGGVTPYSYALASGTGLVDPNGYYWPLTAETAQVRVISADGSSYDTLNVVTNP